MKNSKTNLIPHLKLRLSILNLTIANPNNENENNMNLQEYRSNLETATAHAPTESDVDAKLAAEMEAIQRQIIERAAAKASKGAIDEAALQSLVENELAPLKSRLDDAEMALDSAKKLEELIANDSKVKARTKALVSASSGKDPVMEVLLPYYKAGQPNRSKVMLLSPPSFGKTRAINALGATYDLYLAHGCSPDCDENSTMLGGVLPDGKGSFMINDGKLTQAVRAASEGFNVLLALDEILRLSESTVAFILTFLEPRDTATGKRYFLTTRKVDGDALEEISCSVDHLHIIAAANLGAIKPQEALWDRFDQKRLKFTFELARSNSASILREVGGIDDIQLAEKYAYAMVAARRLANEGRIAFPLSFRRLVSACENNPNPLEYVKESLEGWCTSWDSVSGDDIDDSSTALDEVRRELA